MILRASSRKESTQKAQDFNNKVMFQHRLCDVQ